jgi:hypothetical protein
LNNQLLKETFVNSTLPSTDCRPPVTWRIVSPTQIVQIQLAIGLWKANDKAHLPTKFWALQLKQQGVTPLNPRGFCEVSLYPNLQIYPYSPPLLTNSHQISTLFSSLSSTPKLILHFLL